MVRRKNDSIISYEDLEKMAVHSGIFEKDEVNGFDFARHRIQKVKYNGTPTTNDFQAFVRFRATFYHKETRQDDLHC